MQNVIIISEPLVYSINERNNLIKQAADRGIVLFLKQFIPMYLIRYWLTRHYLGAVVAYFALNLFALNVIIQGSDLSCASEDFSCKQQSKSIVIAGGVIAIASSFVFGIHSGILAKKARLKLGISRQQAVAILPAIHKRLAIKEK